MTLQPGQEIPRSLETARPLQKGEAIVDVRMSAHAADQLALACSRAEGWALERWDAGDQEAALVHEWLSWGARWLVGGMRAEVSGAS